MAVTAMPRTARLLEVVLVLVPELVLEPVPVPVLVLELQIR